MQSCTIIPLIGIICPGFIEIAFKPKYCMNVLKNITDENVYFDMTSSISPCVVRPVQGDGFYYLIVPVRTYSQY